MTEKYNPVGWFEIPVSELTRAKQFYETVLNIQLEEHEMGPLRMAWFPMKEDLMGAAGSLVLADGYTPSHTGTLVYFSVADIEHVSQNAARHGGKVLQSKMSIGEYGFIALLEDSEGNRIGVHSRQ